MTDREYIDWWDADTALDYFRDDGITAYCINNQMLVAKNGATYDGMVIDFILIARRPCLLVGTPVRCLEQTRHAYRGTWSRGWLGLAKLDESLGGAHLVWKSEDGEEGCELDEFDD
jgi:hypothetical protein